MGSVRKSLKKASPKRTKGSQKLGHDNSGNKSQSLFKSGGGETRKQIVGMKKQIEALKKEMRKSQKSHKSRGFKSNKTLGSSVARKTIKKSDGGPLVKKSAASGSKPIAELGPRVPSMKNRKKSDTNAVNVKLEKSRVRVQSDTSCSYYVICLVACGIASLTAGFGGAYLRHMIGDASVHGSGSTASSTAKPQGRLGFHGWSSPKTHQRDHGLTGPFAISSSQSSSFDSSHVSDEEEEDDTTNESQDASKSSLSRGASSFMGGYDPARHASRILGKIRQTKGGSSLETSTGSIITQEVHGTGSSIGRHSRWKSGRMKTRATR